MRCPCGTGPRTATVSIGRLRVENRENEPRLRGLPHCLTCSLENCIGAFYDLPVRFKARLQEEFVKRKRVNFRYTLRSFARFLRVDHATLSQLLRARRRVTARTIRAWGPRLGLSPEAIELACESENEAAVLAALDRPGFLPDTRWLAVQLNIPVDDVNVALQTLLRRGVLRMESKQQWRRGDIDG